MEIHWAKDPQFAGGERGPRTGVGERDITEPQRGEEVLGVQANVSLSANDLHRGGSEVVALAAVGVDPAGLVGIDPVEHDVLQPGVGHAAPSPVTGQAAGMDETHAEGRHVQSFFL